MSISGKHIIGSNIAAEASNTFYAYNPSTGEKLEPAFPESTNREVNEAVSLAKEAFETSPLNREQKVALLNTIADNIMDLGDELVARVHEETALPEARIIGERGRTVGQLKLFAKLIEDGDWVRATLERAQPDREPLPKPDLRSMQFPIGPVVIFGASNFPLAFSVAGGDSASALAAGNPIIVKGHPAHPGTSELVAGAIAKAIKTLGIHPGYFSHLQGTSNYIGLTLIQHPDVKAGGFTGSIHGGRSLYDAAQNRPDPIPFHAEMGSTNPVFVLEHALKNGAETLAQTICTSVNMGVGQFCTSPGIVLTLEDYDTSLIEELGAAFSNSDPGTMLYANIKKAFNEGLERIRRSRSIEVLGKGKDAGGENQVSSHVFCITASEFTKEPELLEENFGPSVIVVRCKDISEMKSIALGFKGQLTASFYMSEEEATDHQDLLRIMRDRAGRVLFNGMPTGVEVCHAMVHGGPYPASSNGQATSVGTDAIYRFSRQVCFQNSPDSVLPDELKDNNPLQIWRKIDGQLCKD